MLSGVPNCAVALGYLTASWTLRVDLVWTYVCRLLQYMRAQQYKSVCPRHPDAAMRKSSIFDIFNSTYLNRGAKTFFYHGTTFPYRYNSNYYCDWWTFKYGALRDKHIEFR